MSIENKIYINCDTKDLKPEEILIKFRSKPVTPPPN